MILVIGATGRIGGLVAQELTSLGRPVRCLVRQVARARERLPAAAELVEGDLAAPDTLAQAMRGIRKVFLCSPIEPAMAAMQINAVRAAADAGVQGLVKLSGSPWTMLPGDATRVGAAHADVEAQVAASGLRHAFIRPNAFSQGSLARVAAEVTSRSQFSLAIGDARVSFTDVRDIGSACVQALRDDGVPSGAIEITGPVALGGADIAAALSKHLQADVCYVQIDIDEALERARAGGASAYVLAHQREVLQRLRAGAAQGVTTAFESLCQRPARHPMAYLEESAAALSSPPASAGMEDHTARTPR